MPAIAPFASGWLARPLLSRSRAELEAWARSRTRAGSRTTRNADETLDRNYLRRRVLPLIRERWPGSRGRGDSLARGTRRKRQRLLDMLARADVERASYGESLSVQTLRALPPDRRRNALRFWITQRRLSRARHSPPGRNRRPPARRARRMRIRASTWGGARERALAPAFNATAICSNCSAARMQHGHRRELVAGGGPADGSYCARSDARRQLRRCLVLARIAALRAADELGTLELKADPHGPIDLDALPERARHSLARWRRAIVAAPWRSASHAQELTAGSSRAGRGARASSAALFGDAAGRQLLAVADLWLDETVQATSATRHRGRLYCMDEAQGTSRLISRVVVTYCPSCLPSRQRFFSKRRKILAEYL